MATKAKTLRYVSDGTYSVKDSRPALERHGELVSTPAGDTKFVPDDPTFPTTVFRRDGIVEFYLDDPQEARVEEYVALLSRWLKAGLQLRKE
jgi:hypothetical protein